MKLPRGVARFNRRYGNRVQGIWAPYLPPWAMIAHVGRRSAKAYRTPVVASCSRNRLVVALVYGEESDWVHNVLANGGGEVTRLGRTRTLVNPRIVESRGNSEELGRLTRLWVGIAEKMLIADVAEPPAVRPHR